MTTRSNLHTHSLYCDGSNTIEEMTEAAIAAGFESIGFSSHAYTGYEDDECGIKKDKVEEYFATLEKVKKEYSDRIRVFTGLELESRVKGEGRPVIDHRCDYTIGSCHIYRKNEKRFCVDNTVEDVQKAIKAYDGDKMALLENYYAEMANFAEEVDFDIVGHIDLPTKFNECLPAPLFEETEEYKKMALHYIDRIIRTDKIFEVNTGAISRKKRVTPYPSPFILEHLQKKHVPVTISSDCHNKDWITCHFEESEQLLRSLGFKTQMKLTEKGFVSVPL